MASASTIKINPNFTLPPGVTDIGYGIAHEVTESSADPTAELPFDMFGDGTIYEGDASTDPAGGGTVASGGLKPPLSIVVISQKAYADTSGNIVVDVVIEVPDVPGVVAIEAKVSKG